MRASTTVLMNCFFLLMELQGFVNEMADHHDIDMIVIVSMLILMLTVLDLEAPFILEGKSHIISYNLTSTILSQL